MSAMLVIGVEYLMTFVIWEVIWVQDPMLPSV